MRLKRLVGFNLLSAVVLGVMGFYAGWWLGHLFKAPSIAYFDNTDQNDIALFLAYLTCILGFLVGLGFANYPIQSCSVSHRRFERRRPRARGVTLVSVPTTRSSGCST